MYLYIDNKQKTYKYTNKDPLKIFIITVDVFLEIY